jgi:hypothetical protein
VLLAQRRPCQLRLVCRGAVADTANPYPPLALHHHISGSGCCRLLPACLRCQKLQSTDIERMFRLRGGPVALAPAGLNRQTGDGRGNGLSGQSPRPRLSLVIGGGEGSGQPNSGDVTAS